MGTVTDFDWQGFRRLVDDYEALLGQSVDLLPARFNRIALASVSRLFCEGASMPTCDEISEQCGDDAGSELDGEADAEISSERWLATVGEWRETLSTFLGELDHYSEVFNSAEGDVVETTLSDDLSDVLGDLKEGALLWDSGQECEAMWEWSFRFIH
ncbi:MAG: DUF5063 domain-containing protein [Actinomycetota bacterium]|nr:DUF5063 domain-containing protein [Actinomycetota bacterium]